MSAHLDYHNERARSHCDEAFAERCEPSRIVGMPSGANSIVSLDLNGSDVDELFDRLIELDDGSAISEVRLAIARFQVAVRRRDLLGPSQRFDSADHLLPRITEPHTRSSFQFMPQRCSPLQGHLRTAALVSAARCEQYAEEVRLSFVVPYAQRVRAMAELGLRHFARSRQILDRIADDQPVTRTISSTGGESHLIALGCSRQGLPTRAIQSLQPDRDASPLRTSAASTWRPWHSRRPVQVT